MAIETSAVVALLNSEPEAKTFESAVAADPVRLVAATCVFEARMVLVSRRGVPAIGEIDLWFAKAGVQISPVDFDLADLATQAWLTFGKGRHGAALNFAACFSYAPARRSGEPLLFKGDDVSKTDVRRDSAA